MQTTVPGNRPGINTELLGARKNPLDYIFSPVNVAVIGATEKEGSVGRDVMRNLVTTPFGGTVFPVNPKRDSVLGIKAYASILKVPAAVDLAVFCTPAASIPDTMRECVQAGVKSALVISAGFKEIGPQGVELERRLMEEARKGGIRIIGPNCLGIMRPPTGLNASFAAQLARPGNVAFVTQSGALLTAILDWSMRQQVGYSAFISIGSMLDVGWGDLIDYLGKDPLTKSILIYMESIGDARAFLSAAREAALSKPIIVIKAGRSSAGAQAAASHTGSLTGSDDVVDAAFRRSGILRVDSVEEIFHMAEVLGKQPRPKGNRLTLLTNAGGPGVLATDALIENGGVIGKLSPATVTELSKFLPDAWSHGNPVDILGDASPERYRQALETAAKDENSDGMLAILTPQSMTDAKGTAEALSTLADKTEGKPLLASWMGGAAVEEGAEILRKAGIPCFSYPDQAAKMFSLMWQYANNLTSLYETPSYVASHLAARAERAAKILQAPLSENRTILSEFESKQMLEAYGIPCTKALLATGEDEAAAKARELGFPVVLKLHSRTLTHKTDVGGVKLNIQSEEAARKAFAEIRDSVAQKAGAQHFEGVSVQPMIKLEGYELIFGSSVDPQIGPVLLFGTGGQLVEVFKDRALGLPPLNSVFARQMMEQSRIYKALKGVRGRKAVDLQKLEQVLVSFSQLVVEQPRIKEIDINPFLVGPDGMIALDARVILHEPGISDSQLPKPAIRPYPIQYVSGWSTRNGTPVLIRPIRPEDEPLMVEFHSGLSERSVYQRYFQVLRLDQRTAHERLLQICMNDFDRQIALVAERTDPKTGKPEILAVGRLAKVPGMELAEFGLLVRDNWQEQGLGTQLLKLLAEAGKKEKIGRMVGAISADNVSMQKVCKELGFELKNPESPGGFVLAEMKL